VNGKIYIGQHTGVDLHKYLRRNICDALNGDVSKPYLYNAIRKYGADCFIIEPLVSVKTQEQLDAKEIELIATYESTDPLIGYNVSSGGRGAGLGNKNCLDCHPSEETRLKMSLAHKGHPGYWLGKNHSEATRHRMSVVRKGRLGTFIGRQHSEETKKRMSEAHRGRHISNMA